MSSTRTLKTRNKHESTWDENGSQQWTYFHEEIKQRINFFLSQRLNGKNLDLGGGWYLSYKDSTVVDLSSVCLDHNPAKEKVQFDLEEIARGKKLPFKDHSFDSATMISVWQYVTNPKKVMNELERVLKPGSEVYVINGQGAGVGECIRGLGRTPDIANELSKMRYDTLIEFIPSFGGNVKEFQSVCAAMPGQDLFGKSSSAIRDKERRVQENELVKEDPSAFTTAFVDAQIGQAANLLCKLARYPITKHSQEYLARIEEFSQELARRTGGFPLLFLDNTIHPELLMALPEHEPFATMYFLGEESREDGKFIHELRQQYGLCFSNHSNYFDFKDKKRLVAHWKNFEKAKDDYSEQRQDIQVRKYADFISSIPLNSMTQQLQAEAMTHLETRVEGFIKKVMQEKAFNFHMATCEYKQKTRISELIDRKQRILAGEAEIVGDASLDFIPHLKQMDKYFAK